MESGTWLTRVVEVLQPISLRADRLAATETFSGLPRQDLELAATELNETLVERGTRLTVQGKLGGRFWLILEGQALVSADARPLRVVAAGDLVGLAGMLYRAGSPETTIALSPIRALRLTMNRSTGSWPQTHPDEACRRGGGAYPSRFTQAEELGGRLSGGRRPAPEIKLEYQAPNAATTFEKTFWIWLPMVRRMTMTTIETSTRIRAYSTMPWPLCGRRSRLSKFLPPFLRPRRVFNTVPFLTFEFSFH